LRDRFGLFGFQFRHVESLQGGHLSTVRDTC
jgi:hypothetical protein